MEALDELVDFETRGNPHVVLRWMSTSTVNLAAELVRQGRGHRRHRGASLEVRWLLLLGLAKEKEGTAHPNRGAQSCYVNDRVGAFLVARQPVIPVGVKRRCYTRSHVVSVLADRR